MTALEVVPKKNKPESSAEEVAAMELVRASPGPGPIADRPDGLLKQFTKSVVETVLDKVLAGHLGHERHRAPGTRDSTKVRNGSRPKTVLTEATGRVQIDVTATRGRSSRRS